MATTLLITAIHLSSWVPAATSNHFTVYYKHHTHSLFFRQQSTTHTHTNSCESRHISTTQLKAAQGGSRNTYYCYACSPDWNIMLSSAHPEEQSRRHTYSYVAHGAAAATIPEKKADGKYNIIQCTFYIFMSFVYCLYMKLSYSSYGIAI